jgi:hypothetical protein
MLICIDFPEFLSVQKLSPLTSRMGASCKYLCPEAAATTRACGAMAPDEMW